jgi:hypothetical protein
VASIPLPALHVQPPQQQDLMGEAGKVMGLQSMLQQQKSGAIDLQMKQQQLKDQQTVMQTLAAHKGDLQSALPSLAGSVSPQTYMGLQKYNLDTRKTLAEIDDKELATRKDQNDRFSQLVSTASQLPPDQYAQQYPQIAAAAKQIKPDLKIDPSQPIPQAQLQQMGMGLLTTEQYIKQEAERRAAKMAPIEQNLKVAETGKDVAQGNEAQGKADQQTRQTAATQLANAQNQGEYDQMRGKMPYTMASQFPSKFDKDKILQMGMTPDQVVTTNQGAARIGIERGRLAQETKKITLDYMNAGFKSDGSPMTAADASPSARQIVAGKMDPATARALLRKQPGLYNQVLAADPSFDEATLDRRFSFNKELTNYSPAHIGGQALALNTLVHHTDLMYDLVDGLKNGSFVPGNALYNKVASTFGSAPIAKFNTVKDFLVSEAAKSAHGGIPNESDVARSLENMKNANSPEALKGALGEYLEVAGGKMQSINEQGRQNGMGDSFTVLGPEAKAIVQKHGIDPVSLKPASGGQGGALSVTDPNGGVHTFKTQAEADNFKKAINK